MRRHGDKIGMARSTTSGTKIFTATYNGISWTATVRQGVWVQGSLSISGHDGQGRSLSISALNINGPGTYSLAANNPNTALATRFPAAKTERERAALQDSRQRSGSRLADFSRRMAPAPDRKKGQHSLALFAYGDPFRDLVRLYWQKADHSGGRDAMREDFMDCLKTRGTGRCVLTLTVTVAFLFSILVHGVPAQESSASSQPFPSACAFTFTSGTGGSLLRFCVTQSGNVIYLEMGQGVEHIYHYGQGTIEEGYAVCADPNPAPWYYSQYYDTYESLGAYWKFPVVISTNPLIIERTTVDDGFRLRQKFMPNAAEQELVIEMRLTNISKISRTNVVLKRIADLDIDFTHQDDLWDHTYSSIWARNAARNAGVTLRALPGTIPTIPNFAAVEYAGVSYPCLTESHPTPEIGDHAGHVGSLIGTMAPNAVRILKVKYSPQ